ncbi:hypothetical protein ACLKA6_008053 [Drosophila palustris]
MTLACLINMLIGGSVRKRTLFGPIGPRSAAATLPVPSSLKTCAPGLRFAAEIPAMPSTMATSVQAKPTGSQ